MEQSQASETQRPQLFHAIAKLNSQLALRGVNLRALKSIARAMTVGRERASIQELRAARKEMQALVRQLEGGQKSSEQKISRMRQQIFNAAFLALFGGAALEHMLYEKPKTEEAIARTAEDVLPVAFVPSPLAQPTSPPPTIAPSLPEPLPNPPQPEQFFSRDYFFLTPYELSRLKNYAGSFRLEEHTDQQISRTFAGRLDDHIIFLRDIASHFFNGNGPPVFIDIGPGVANPQSPAVTSVEMARAFPNMHVVAFDLPEEVAKFQTRVPSYKREALRRMSNFTVVSGDGLKSLRDQIRYPLIPADALVIIRTANAIDIYCDWKDVEPALVRMAEDFRDNPVVLFFNREILWKLAGEAAWKNIGQVSDRGFRHNSRDLRRNGAPPYYLKPEYQFLKPQPRPRISPQPIEREPDLSVSEFPTETPEFLKPAIGRLERFGLQQGQYAMVVNIPSQTLFVVRDRSIERTYRISTGKKGVGLTAGHTPPGMHRVDRKAGALREIGERVKDGTSLRIFTDATEETRSRPANIVTRALYLAGLEQNNGEAALRRGVAIHGTDHENLIGQPASHGCVRMFNRDVIELFNLIPADALVEISPENA